MPSWFGRILACCCQPAKSYFRTGLESVDGQHDALLWHKDLKSIGSVDFSIAVVQANEILEDQGQVQVSHYGTYVGIYDGHGGPEASRFITSHLFSKIEKFAQEHRGISSEVLKKAFEATEKEFLVLVDEFWRTKPQIAAVGSCCLVGVISMNKIYVANVGDSRAVLGTTKKGHKGVVPQRLSTEHNAGIVEVRRELKAQHPDDSHIVVLKHGVWRVKGIIQVSRSIGDVYLKKPEFKWDPLFPQLGSGYPVELKRPVLTAEPSIHEFSITPQDEFLIFASDGLWEQLSDQEAVNIVHSSPRKGIARRLIQSALREAAKKREMRYSDLRKIERGVRRYFHDDITVVVFFLDQNLGESSFSAKGNATVNAPSDVFSLQSLRITA